LTLQIYGGFLFCQVFFFIFFQKVLQGADSQREKFSLLFFIALFLSLIALFSEVYCRIKIIRLF